MSAPSERLVVKDGVLGNDIMTSWLTILTSIDLASLAAFGDLHYKKLFQNDRQIRLSAHKN